MPRSRLRSNLTSRGGAMKKLVITVAIALVATALGASAGAGANAPVRVTFDKQLANPATLTFAGTSGGDAAGTLTSQLVSIDAESGPVVHVTFDWFISAGAKSFVART